MKPAITFSHSSLSSDFHCLRFNRPACEGFHCTQQISWDFALPQANQRFQFDSPILVFLTRSAGASTHKLCHGAARHLCLCLASKRMNQKGNRVITLPLPGASYISRRDLQPLCTFCVSECEMAWPYKQPGASWRCQNWEERPINMLCDNILKCFWLSKAVSRPSHATDK